MGGTTERMVEELQAIILSDYALEIPTDQAERIGDFILSFFGILASVGIGKE